MKHTTCVSSLVGLRSRSLINGSVNLTISYRGYTPQRLTAWTWKWWFGRWFSSSRHCILRFYVNLPGVMSPFINWLGPTLLGFVKHFFTSYNRRVSIYRVDLSLDGFFLNMFFRFQAATDKYQRPWRGPIFWDQIWAKMKPMIKWACDQNTRYLLYVGNYLLAQLLMGMVTSANVGSLCTNQYHRGFWTLPQIDCPR